MSSSPASKMDSIDSKPPHYCQDGHVQVQRHPLAALNIDSQSGHLVPPHSASLLSAHRVARHWPHRRAGLDRTRRKIKELTPCHAESIQEAIPVPWQQMKTRRPSLDGGAAPVHSPSPPDRLARKLTWAAMATDRSCAERERGAGEVVRDPSPSPSQQSGREFKRRR